MASISISSPPTNIHSPGPIGDVTPDTVSATQAFIGGHHLIKYSTANTGQLQVRTAADDALANLEVSHIFFDRLVWGPFVAFNSDSGGIELNRTTSEVAFCSGNPSIGGPDVKLFSPVAGVTATMDLTNSQTASIGGVIFADFTTTSTTSTNGTEDNLYSHTTVAGQLAANGDSIEQLEHVSFVSSVTAARRCKKYFGGTLIFDSGSLTLSLGGEFDILTTIIRETSTVVRVSVLVTSTSASSIPYSTYTRITGLTLSSTNILKTTGIASGTGAATADIANVLSKVWWYPTAY